MHAFQTKEIEKNVPLKYPKHTKVVVVLNIKVITQIDKAKSNIPVTKEGI